MTATMEVASCFKRISLAQGLGALHMAVLPQAPSFLGVVPAQWERILHDSAVPAFLSSLAPLAATQQWVAPYLASRHWVQRADDSGDSRRWVGTPES